MKKLLLLLALLFTALAAAACSGPASPGELKTKYWVSDDLETCFYFPTDGDLRAAEGKTVTDQALIRDIYLKWDEKGGVEVSDGGGALFHASCATDEKALVCVLSPDAEESSFPGLLSFHWAEEPPAFFTADAFMPDGTSLEYWILQDVGRRELPGHIEKPGWFGAREYYGGDYTPVRTDFGDYYDPSYCVKYLITAWPDYADGGNFITNIAITDPAVTVWGLNVLSSVSEFDKVLLSKGFRRDDPVPVPPAAEYSAAWVCGTYSVKLTKIDGKCSLVLNAPVSNRDAIIF